MALGVLTISEAAKAAGIPRRTLHDWLVARAKVDPGLILKFTGKKRWLISKAGLAAMLGLDVQDVESSLDRHGKEIDALKRRVRVLEQQLARARAPR